MPTSHLYQIHEIVTLIRAADPFSLLDIGCGFGKYGFLAREYLELWDGREKYLEWRRRIDGVEGCAEYITDLQRLIYNNIYLGHAQEVLPTLNFRYDLILMVDVIEHFDKDEGREVLRHCQRLAKNLIISTPKTTIMRDGTFGNPLEAHVSQWTLEDLAWYGPNFVINNQSSLIVFLGQDAEAVYKKLTTKPANEPQP